MNETVKKRCCCPCHVGPGLWVALFGLAFLLKNAGVITDELNNWIWPSIVLLGGLNVMCSKKCLCCKNPGCE